MTGEYQIVLVEKPEEAVWELIGKGLDTFNIQQAGEYGVKRICFGVQAADESFAGGILGEIFWNWLHIDLLWVKEELRGQGYGHQLLTHMEEEARKLGAKNVFLDTFSFQAPEFYKKHGYRVFGELRDFPLGHQRFFLTKQL
jgi:GNAT superfamily N-acetyltransferase